MKKVKLVVAEKFVGERELKDVLISAFQTELSVLKNDEISVIMKRPDKPCCQKKS